MQLASLLYLVTVRSFALPALPCRPAEGRVHELGEHAVVRLDEPTQRRLRRGELLRRLVRVRVRVRIRVRIRVRVRVRIRVRA